jgi:phosphatidylserine/phosphatidylglycerophosphate/cardiolipin synthase-like enzyme
VALLAEKVKFSVLFLVVGLIVGLTVGFSFGSQAQAEWKERYVELQKAYNELEKVYENLHLAYLKLKETTFFQVDLLEDKEYYREAFRLISNANKTIYIIMYVVKYDPKEADDPVNILLKGLVEAKNVGLMLRFWLMMKL